MSSAECDHTADLFQAKVPGSDSDLENLTPDGSYSFATEGSNATLQATRGTEGMDPLDAPWLPQGDDRVSNGAR